MRDCWSVFSSMGPRMIARIKGEGGKANFRNRYPMTPKKIIMPTSHVELFTL